MASILPLAETQFVDQNGLPIALGTVAFYIPNTLTPKDTYQDSAASSLNANPVSLDAAGRALIWGIGTYRQIVKDLNGNTIWDQITSDGAGANINQVLSLSTIAALLAFPKPILAAGQTIVVTVEEYATGSAHGGGQLRWQANSNQSGDNVLVFNPTGNVGSGRWIRIINGFFTNGMAGAFIDGATDDTTANQTAVTLHVSSKIPLMFEAGTTNISAAIGLNGINIANLNIYGAGYGATVFNQTGSTPGIFQLNATSFSFNNTFRGMTGQWLTPDATKTNRAFIYCPSTGNTDFFNNTFESISLVGGHYVVKSVGPSFWGTRLWDITGSDVTGGITYTIPDHTTGQPNNSFVKHYVDARATALTVYQGSGSQIRFDSIELNVASLSCEFMNDSGGGDYPIGKFRLETGTYSVANRFMFNVPNADMQAQNIEVVSLTITQPTYLFAFNANPNTAVDIRYIDVGNFAISGAGAFYINAAGTSSATVASSQINIGKIFNRDGWSSAFALCNNSATAGAIGLVVESWNDTSRVNINGDASFTWTPGSAPVQYFGSAAVPLTANRTGTLESPSSNNLFDGIIRIGYKLDATGAGTYTQNGDTIAANKRGWIKSKWVRGGTGISGFTWTNVEVVSY